MYTQGTTLGPRHCLESLQPPLGEEMKGSVDSNVLTACTKEVKARSEGGLICSMQ